MLLLYSYLFVLSCHCQCFSFRFSFATSATDVSRLIYGPHVFFYYLSVDHLLNHTCHIISMELVIIWNKSFISNILLLIPLWKSLLCPPCSFQYQSGNCVLQSPWNMTNMSRAPQTLWLIVFWDTGLFPVYICDVLFWWLHCTFFCS